MQRILGQDHALGVLQGALRSGRLHHAWIFYGPKGVGKFTTAIEFARLLLDPAAEANLAGEIESDPSGPVSSLIDAGTHPDLHLIRKELARYSADASIRDRKLTTIPVGVLREHIIGGRVGDKRVDGPAYLTPSLGHGKVLIVDESELINEDGQNALLKTLEEPPSKTYIILVTSRLERLLPTVRSRCQLVRFASLNAEAIATWFDRSELEVSDDERVWLEAFCDGSPGVATLAAEYKFHEWRLTLAPYLRALDDGDYSGGMGPAMAELVESFAVAWVKGNKNASKDAANKDGVRHLFTVLAAHARNRLAQADDDPERTRWLSAIDDLANADRFIASNVNVKHVLENLSVQLAS